MNKYSGYTEYMETEHIYAQDLKGWELIEIVYKEGASCERWTNYRDGYNAESGVVLPYKTPVYVFGRKENETVAAMQRRVDYAVAEVLQIRKDYADLKEENKKHGATIIDLNSKLDCYRNESVKKQDMLQKSLDQNAAFEKDIVKIRKALGDIRMNEILGVEG